MKKKPALWIRALRWISPTWWFRRCAPLYLKDADTRREAYTLKLRQLESEIRQYVRDERQRSNLLHTHSKLAMFMRDESETLRQLVGKLHKP